MLHELRIYQIFPHNREAFPARFRDHALPAWDLFFADEEWKETKRRTAAEHGELVGKTSSRLLRAAPQMA